MATPIPADFSLPTDKPIFLVLDLDGTLAPIRKDPSAVRLSNRVSNVLEKLHHQRVKLIVVSGRPAPFLRKTLPLWMPLVSEHGAQPLDRKQRRWMQKVHHDLDALCHGWPGAHLEFKSSALAVHYRNMPKDRQAAFVATLHARFKRWGVRVLEGRKVFELIFAKGSKKSEVQKLLRRHRNAFFVALGDDVTDERVFDAVNRAGGVSIHVGNKRQPTCAQYVLLNVGAVHAFLEKMVARTTSNANTKTKEVAISQLFLTHTF